MANWKVANHLEPGSVAFFQEVERYRFDKLNYLEDLADFDTYAGKSVLDVGCGLGTDLARFARAGAETTGIDISPRAIELAQKNFEWRSLEDRFYVMDGENLDFPDNTFDFVYCHTVLHFTRDPAEMVREIYRVLKPGGHALLMAINRRSWLYFLHRVANVKIDYMDAPVFHKLDSGQFSRCLDVFESSEIQFYRFPVPTEVHKGWKAALYNTIFVRSYLSLPKRIIRPTGYHMVAIVQKQKSVT